MAKLTYIEIKTFNMFAGFVKRDHDKMLERRKLHIEEMARILYSAGYTKRGIVNSIHTTLQDTLNSMIEIKKSWIEDIVTELDFKW